MDLIRQHKKNTLVLVPDGTFEAGDADKFMDAVLSRSEDEKDVTVDGMLMTGIEPEGIEAFVHAREKVMSGNGRFLLRNMSENVMMFLEFTELVYLFEIDNKLIES